jgi:hypothetical protein
MVVRITKMNGSKPSVLKVDGLLEAADVGVLHHEWATAAGMVTLDLSELRSADGIGVDAIRFLESQGAELRGLCPYLELLVRAGRSNGEASDSKDQIRK